MKIQMKALKMVSLKSIYVGAVVCIVLIGAGCARTQKTTTTQTTLAYPSSNEVGMREEQNRVIVEKDETITSTTQTRSGQRGILSSTVHAIGWVIALPFRLVGGLIGWIF